MTAHEVTVIDVMTEQKVTRGEGPVCNGLKGRSQECVGMERVGDYRALSGRLGGLSAAAVG